MASVRSESEDDSGLLKELGDPDHKIGNIWFYKHMSLNLIGLYGGAFYIPSVDRICVSRNKMGQKLLGVPMPSKEVVMHECGHRFFKHSNIKNWIIANINECMADTFSIVKCRNFKIIKILLPILENMKIVNPMAYKLHWIRVQYMKILVCLFRIPVGEYNA